MSDEDVKVTFGADASGVEAAAAKSTAATGQVEGAVRELDQATKEAATTDEEWLQIQKKLNAAHAEFIAASAAKASALQEFKDHTQEVITGVQGQIAAEAQLKAQQAIQQHLAAAKTSIGETVVAFRQLIAIFGISLGVNYFKNLIEGAISSTAQLEILHQRTGLTVPSLAALSVVSKETGTSLEGMAMGLRRLGVFMVQHNDKLQAAGITAKTTEGALVQLADIFQKLPEGPERTALAISLFGRSGEQMISMLIKGSAELQNMIDKGKELNPVTEEMAVKAHDFEVSMIELKTQANYAWIELSQNMLPTLRDMVEQFREGIKEGGLLNGVLRAIGGAVVGGPKEVNEKNLQKHQEERLVVEGQLQAAENETGVIFEKEHNKAIAYYKYQISALDDMIAREKARKELLDHEAKPKTSQDTVMHADGTFGSASGSQTDAERRAKLLEDKKKGSAKTPDTSEQDLEVALAKKSLETKIEFWKGEVAAKNMTEVEKLELTKEAEDKVFVIERRAMLDKVNLYKERSKQYQTELNKVVLLDAQRGLDTTKNTVEMQAAQRKAQKDSLVIEEEASKSKIALWDEGTKIESAYLDQQVAMGHMTAVQKLVIERQYLQSVHDAESTEMGRMAEFYRNDEKEYQKHLDAKAKFDAAFNVTMQKNTNTTILAEQKEWQSLLQPIASAFDTTVKGIIMGTTTLQKGMSNIFQSGLMEFLSMCTGMMVKWAALEAWKLATTKAGSVERAALEDTTSLASIVKKKLEALGFVSVETAKKIGRASCRERV